MGLFNDDKGNVSMMRLLSLIVVVATLPVLYLHPEQSPSICLLIGGVVGAKSLQKHAER